MINYDLTKIKALVFDVDGVLSGETIYLHPNGEPMRSVNIKDGYALQLAVKCGSYAEGGYGCGRDVVEQVLRAQGKWMSHEKAFGW